MRDDSCRARSVGSCVLPWPAARQVHVIYEQDGSSGRIKAADWMARSRPIGGGAAAPTAAPARRASMPAGTPRGGAAAASPRRAGPPKVGERFEVKFSKFGSTWLAAKVSTVEGRMVTVVYDKDGTSARIKAADWMARSRAI